MPRFRCACDQYFPSWASLQTHLEANPEHWRPSNGVLRWLEADDNE